MIRTRRLMDEWRDTLITELRLRQVPGSRIGEALAEIDTHCADSGQTPHEAFGDPVEYARSLTDNLAPAQRKGVVRRVLRPAAQMFATLAGIFGVLSGVDALAHGTRGTLTVGQLVGVALGTALFPAIVATLFSPALFRRMWLWAGAVIVAPAVTALPVVLWDTPVLHLSGWVLLVCGLFLVATAWWPTASDRILADLIIDPRTGSEPFARSRGLIALTRWWLPGMLLIMAVIVALIPAP